MFQFVKTGVPSAQVSRIITPIPPLGVEVAFAAAAYPGN